MISQSPLHCQAFTVTIYPKAVPADCDRFLSCVVASVTLLVSGLSWVLYESAFSILQTMQVAPKGCLKLSKGYKICYGTGHWNHFLLTAKTLDFIDFQTVEGPCACCMPLSQISGSSGLVAEFSALGSSQSLPSSIFILSSCSDGHLRQG